MGGFEREEDKDKIKIKERGYLNQTMLPEDNNEEEEEGLDDLALGFMDEVHLFDFIVSNSDNLVW